jgi:hypothetical protein
MFIIETAYRNRSIAVVTSLCWWAMFLTKLYSYFWCGAVFYFLFWCRYVASAGVVLCLVVLLGMVIMNETYSVISIFLINCLILLNIKHSSYLLKYKIVAIDGHHLFIYIPRKHFVNISGKNSRHGRLLSFNRFSICCEAVKTVK